MNEPLFYHAVAIAGHGDYHSIKKFRAGTDSWEAAYASLRENGVPLSDPENEYERLDRLGIRIAMSADTEYPDSLRHISHPPFALYLRGGEMPSGPPMLAVVGTRRASADGKKIARRFACELAAGGFAIASGLAFGIDGAAHEGALDAGGRTVAVLAGGLDDVYPHAHDALARRILDAGGTLISEYPPGEEPFGYRFIERNRIISGISQGVLIVEAPESSGALATARYAAEQNRDVFVVPGAVTANNFKGSHALIRQGAELVASPGDILDAYGMKKEIVDAARSAPASPEEILVLTALRENSAAVDVDKLAAWTKLEPRAVNQALSFLLLHGIIKEMNAGYTIS